MKKTFVLGLVLLFVLAIMNGCNKASEEKQMEGIVEEKEDLDFLDEGSQEIEQEESEDVDDIFGDAEDEVMITGKVVDITVVASKFVFEPSVIKVKKGDKVRLTLETSDVEHGFEIEGYGVDVKSGKTVEFVADKVGTFRFDCSVVCGSGHKEMEGQFIVE